MSLKNLNIKSSYETGEDDLIEEFYVPVLENSIRYDRIAGFFSSSSLAIAARGILSFIKNNGKMRILACPKMNKQDIEIINNVKINSKKYIEDSLIKNLNVCEDMFEQQHVNALGWMLLKGLLEIKIAFVFVNGKVCIDNDGIFHQKVGILYDSEGNQISFSGSINESANGWLKNIEEFKVFKSWKEEQIEYLQSDIKKFDEFWHNKRSYVKVYDIPEAVKKKLIEYSNNFDEEKLIASEYITDRDYKKISDRLGLFYYQQEAINKWIRNGYKLLFQMATGTGKTRTAIGCINTILKKEKKILIIIACPQVVLSLQWKEEIKNIGINIDKEYVIDGTNRKWKSEIMEAILKLKVDYYKKVIIYTTHKTCSNNEFIKAINLLENEQRIAFIGDEAHGLGSSINRKGLCESYNYRIGLSATPSRWFDESGTIILENYFGNKSFEFSILDALTTINPITNKPFLVNYYYKLSFVELNSDEMERYSQLTNKIIKLKKYPKGDIRYASLLENILFKRAAIIKNANQKYMELQRILDNITEIKDTIIFVSDEQIDNVMEILQKNKIIAHKLTQNEKTKKDRKYNGKSERQYIIQKFKEGYYKVLVAIKCLDEGIDIPSASTAILMASSTNPREYIQRIGRVIRQAPNKEKATIYDISVKPCIKMIKNDTIRKFEKMIMEKERKRLVDISRNAINNVEALKLINSIMED